MASEEDEEEVLVGGLRQDASKDLKNREKLAIKRTYSVEVRRLYAISPHH